MNVASNNDKHNPELPLLVTAKEAAKLVKLGRSAS